MQSLIKVRLHSAAVASSLSLPYAGIHNKS